MNDFGLALNGALLQAHFWIGIYSDQTLLPQVPEPQINASCAVTVWAAARPNKWLVWVLSRFFGEGHGS